MAGAALADDCRSATGGATVAAGCRFVSDGAAAAAAAGCSFAFITFCTLACLIMLPLGPFDHRWGEVSSFFFELHGLRCLFVVIMIASP